VSLSHAAVEQINGLRARFPEPRSALIPALYVAEREVGWLSPEAMRAVAQLLGLPPSVVKGTASFYSLYRHARMGRHIIQLCTNVSCMILGAESLQAHLESRYGLREGEATADGRFSLLIMECIGACDGAPAMQIGDVLYRDLTVDRLDEILAGYE
jgi:NADH-quinone oxidoreductase E subunit